MPNKQIDVNDPVAIEQYALDLVEQSLFHPSEEASQAVERFAQKSPIHRQAVDNAQGYMKASRYLERPQRNFWYKLRYFLELESYRFINLLKGQWVPLVALATSILAVVILTRQTGDPRSYQSAPAEQVVRAEYRTQWRETKDIRLEDGSILWLGSDSIASVTFSLQQRLVKLEKGQAGFKVTKDSMRPFVVKAGLVTTRVTGTEFTVNMFDSKSVEVAVAEGQVEVAVANQAKKRLNAEQAIMADDMLLGDISYRSNHSIGSWRAGTFVFEQRAFIEVLRELAPYSQYRLDISWLDEALLLSPVSGVFFTEQADDALFTVLQSKGLTVEHQEGNQLRVKRVLRPFSS